MEEIRKDASEKYTRMLDLSLKITDDFNSARRLDIEQLRNLILQISVVAFGAVGFSIPIIGSSAELKNPAMFMFGLTLLLIVAVGGFWYSAIVIEKSIKDSLGGYKNNKSEVDEAISNQVFLMQNPNKYNEFIGKVNRFVKKLKDDGLDKTKVEKDMVLYTLLITLTIGIFLVFASLLPIKMSVERYHGNNRNKMNHNFRF